MLPQVLLCVIIFLWLYFTLSFIKNRAKTVENLRSGSKSTKKKVQVRCLINVYGVILKT